MGTSSVDSELDVQNTLLKPNYLLENNGVDIYETVKLIVTVIDYSIT